MRPAMILMAASLAVPFTLLLPAAPAGAIAVGDEAGLRAEFADPTQTSIELTADITLVDCTAGGGDIDRTAGAALTITGNGHTIRQTCPGERIFQLVGGDALTLDGVTVTGGTANNGVAISGSPATLTILNSVITENHGTGNGGAINLGTPVVIRGSTLSNNSTSTSSGGALLTTATVEITDSTISGNSADGSGGGVQGNLGVTVTNSTVTGNAAGGDGGGVLGATVTLVDATVVGNTSPTSANVSTISGDLTSFGSVVALPAGGPNCVVGGITVSNGYNFEDANTCGFGSGPGDIVDGGDPLLGALADNGGPTFTRLPETASPLIDAIPVTSCQADGASGITTDQRGVARPQIGGCDIGAVEVETPPAPPPVVITPTFTG